MERFCQLSKTSPFFLDDCGGRLISEVDWDFIFMLPLLNGMNIPNNDSLLKKYLHSTPLKMEVPIPFFDWTCFFAQCKEFMGPNFFQFVLFFVWRTKCLSLPACSGGCW